MCSDAVSNLVVRPDRGRRFCAVAYAGEDALERADDCDHGISPGYPEAVRRSLAERYPRLAEFEVERGFSGPYDITPDWNPIIGPCPGIAGLYLAVGLERPRVQALARGRRGGGRRGDRAHAADRRLGAAGGAVRRGPAAAARLRARRARVGLRQSGSLPCTTGETVILPPQGAM